MCSLAISTESQKEKLRGRTKETNMGLDTLTKRSEAKPEKTKQAPREV